MSLPTLYLSGAGLPSWIWDDVRSALPGESRVAPSPGPGASLADYGAAALEAAGDWPSFQVVAHSIGGVVAAAVLHAAPERVASLVAVSASVPQPSRSFVAALPAPQRYVMPWILRLVGTRPPAKALREGLAAGLDPATADRIVSEFAPESRALYRDPVPHRAFPAASTYVVTTRDTEFPPTLQEVYADNLGGDVVRIDTAHLPMLEQPSLLVEVLAERLRGRSSPT